MSPHMAHVPPTQRQPLLPLPDPAHSLSPLIVSLPGPSPQLLPCSTPAFLYSLAAAVVIRGTGASCHSHPPTLPTGHVAVEIGPSNLVPMLPLLHCMQMQPSSARCCTLSGSSQLLGLSGAGPR